MSALVTAVVAANAPLAFFFTRTLLRPNVPSRGMWIDCLSGTDLKVSTGYRLGTQNQLLAVDSTSSRNFRAAVRDNNGMWSEFGAVQAAAIPNLTTGSNEASLQGGFDSDLGIRPGLAFPDLSRGSGRIQIFRTLVSQSGAFTDETRTSHWPKGISAFSVKFDSLDDWQLLMLHRFWRALSGPQQCFFFDWVPPEDGMRTTAAAIRYLCRFRDPQLVSSMMSTNNNEMSFVLVEVMEDPEGGDV